MRCFDDQVVAFPMARRETLECMNRVSGRMRSSIHPHDAVNTIRPIEVIRDELARKSVVLLPDCHGAWTPYRIGRRVRDALVFWNAVQRRCPALRSAKACFIQRQ